MRKTRSRRARARALQTSRVRNPLSPSSSPSFSLLTAALIPFLRNTAPL